MGTMIGVVFVTHGTAAPAFVGAIARLCGASSTDGLIALPIDPGSDRPVIAAAMLEAVGRADLGAGVVIACDLVGSTPWNCALELRSQGTGGHPVEIVSGLSLSMALKLASGNREGTTPSALARAAADSVTRCIRVGDGT